MLRRVSAEVQVLRNGGYLGVLRGFSESPPSVKMEDSAAIKTTLSGTFENYVYTRKREKLPFDPYVDELQPVLKINGISSKLGIFVPTSVNPSYSGGSSRETIEIEAYDRSWYLEITTGKERVFFKRGTLYLDAVEQLLAASGIAVINRTESGEVLSEDREDWELGTDYLKIANDLLKEINYKEVWFDATGSAILEPITTPTVAHIQHKLDARDPLTLVHPGLSRKTDFYKTPNVYICVCDNPEKSATLKSVARNTNQYSPLSVQRRGREIISLVKVDNIASQKALDAYANQLLFDSMMTGETINVDTSLLPGWGIGDVVSLHYNDVHALCISRNWNMELKAGGKMTHTLEKIVYNFDDGGQEGA